MGLAPGSMVTANVRLIEPMAHGGMGSVWRADHLGLDAKVAVKFINSDVAGREPSLRERFKREASICARLKSVHVVQTFDHGVMADGTPYIVMELLEGKTFTRMIESGGTISPRQVGVIVSQVGKVLHRAHELGIVHRDIKPDNIFILDDDYELFVKVLDFGIAKTQQGADGDVITKTGAIVGSPEFMSPEQAINSKDVDHRTDLYSLAVVAYYGLTGELPFEEDPHKPFWIQLSDGDHIPATRRLPSLPAAIDGWFDRALAPKPPDRFQTARDMAEALAQIVEVEGVGPVSTLATSDYVSTDFDLSNAETVRMPSARALALIPEGAPADLGSAPTQHALQSDPGPSSAPQPSVPPSSAPPPLAPQRLPMTSLADGVETPPWSQLPAPRRRPALLVVLVGATAIALVLAAVLLLTRI